MALAAALFAAFDGVFQAMDLGGQGFFTSGNAADAFFEGAKLTLALPGNGQVGKLIVDFAQVVVVAQDEAAKVAVFIEFRDFGPAPTLTLRHLNGCFFSARHGLCTASAPRFAL